MYTSNVPASNPLTADSADIADGPRYSCLYPRHPRYPRLNGLSVQVIEMLVVGIVSPPNIRRLQPCIRDEVKTLHRLPSEKFAIHLSRRLTSALAEPVTTANAGAGPANSDEASPSHRALSFEKAAGAQPPRG